ncbi:hypothetical protein GCK72_024672 [Caenorhabditis remanei]|nr:hypothetical protein GCK72_024672 [Caenorhabditis remanei]KAF1748205.1 hypothetical protein GCK72_024672 [Caenorhabditis remanei]
MAILGFTIPFLINSILVGTTAIMLIRNENPLFIVAFITMSLCVTLVLIKSMFHLLRELAGPLQTGPARRLTARDVNRNLEEMLPMSTRPPLSRASTLPSRPMSPIPPESPPSSLFPRTHRSLHRCDIYADI